MFTNCTKLFMAVPLVAISLSPGGAIADNRAVVCVQQELTALNYDPGPPDGKLSKQTLAAADAYIAYMSKTYVGWSQPRLSKSTADQWCKQVAATDPKLEVYLSTYLDSPVLTLTEVYVGKTQARDRPFWVRANYRASGAGVFKGVKGCVSWDDAAPVCKDAAAGDGVFMLQFEAVAAMTGRRKMNVYLSSEASSGAEIASAMYTSWITVSP